MDISNVEEVEPLDYGYTSNEDDINENISDNETDFEIMKRKEYDVLISSQIKTKYFTFKEYYEISRVFYRELKKTSKKKNVTIMPSIIAIYKLKEKDILTTKITQNILFPLVKKSTFSNITDYEKSFNFI